MRIKGLNYEQLYRENKEELLENEFKIEQIDLKLERRQTNLVDAKRNK